MRNGQPNRRFNLFRCAAHHAGEDRGRADRPMNDMIDFVAFQAEHLGQPAADLVDQHHTLNPDNSSRPPGSGLNNPRRI